MTGLDELLSVVVVDILGLSAIIIPPINLGFVLGVQVKPPLPVNPAEVRIPHAAPTATVLFTLLCPISISSIKGEGFVNDQEAKLALVVDVILPLAPKARIAAPGVTVVIAGKLLMDWLVAVVQDDGAATSNRVVLSTPEKATIDPAVAVELAVTVNV